jgi:hypothetical protein
MEYAVQSMFCIIFLIVGLSLLLKGSYWSFWIKERLLGHPDAVLSLGLINLILGSFIVSFHWIWSGFAVVLTVIGLLLLVRAVLCLFFIDYVMCLIKKMLPLLSVWLNIAGLVCLIIASFLGASLVG